MARAKSYVNHKGKRRVLLELTGKEARLLHCVIGAAYYDGSAAQNVWDSLDYLLEDAPASDLPTIMVGKLPPVTWKS